MNYRVPSSRVFFFVMLTLSLLLLSGERSSGVPAPTDSRTEYIERYSLMAVSEMYRSGVPASITLAQGLLESAAGKSVLATEANNHFGIKCGNWQGAKTYHDDDAKGECFRAYDSPLASYRDHSDLLRYRDRYKPLFENKLTDYKAWARGLQKAGYATSKVYASSLIDLIETYKLSEFDSMTIADVRRLYPNALTGEETTAPDTAVGDAGNGQNKDSASNKKASKKKKKNDDSDIAASQTVTYIEDNTEIPPSPLSIEEPERIERSSTFYFSMTRQAYSKNGVPFIYSVKGETLKSIAASNKLFEKEILLYNDMKGASTTEELLPGTIIYVQPKKKHCSKDLSKYIVDSEGETLWGISQRFAVKLESLCKMNGYDSDVALHEGDEIILYGPYLKKKVSIKPMKAISNGKGKGKDEA